MKQFSLQQYAAFSTAFIIMHKRSDSQIIYTDIDPDITLYFHETAYLDIDNNGVFDFAFLNGYSQFYTETSLGSPGAYITRNVQWVGPYSNDDNKIAGSYESFTAPYGGSYNRYYPYALSVNDHIDDYLDFQDWGFQRMAFKSYLSGDFQHYGGNWYLKGIDVYNDYLGIKFLDSDGENHFGWIRCSVTDSAEVLIIKDYAYEMQIDVGIKAGDTSTYVDVSMEEMSKLNCTIYSFGNTVYVTMPEIFTKAELRIYDLLRKEIYFTEIKQNQISIPLKVMSDIYFVQIVAEEGKSVKKIYLQN